MVTPNSTSYTPGLLHVARHREHAHALARLGAELGELGAAVVDDPRQVGERLDVVDDGGLQVEALGGGEERRLEARHAAVALEALDERGLLAHDVGAGAPVEHDVDGEVGAEDVLADVAGGVGVVERLGDALLGQGHLAAHVEERLGGADRVAGDEHALDELVRVLLHEEPVLVGAGLGLVAVHHEVARPHARAGRSPTWCRPGSRRRRGRAGWPPSPRRPPRWAPWPARPSGPRSRRWRGSGRGCARPRGRSGW